MTADREAAPPASISWFTRIVVGAGVLAILVMVGWYLLRQSGTATGDSGAENTGPGAIAAMLQDESLELEEAYDDAVTAADTPTPEQLRLLENAWRAQEDFVRQHPAPAWGDTERLRQLEIKYATARGRGWLAESERLEQESAGLLAAGNREAGIAALQEALRLQREINRSAADETVRRPSRETELALRLQGVDAEPLAEDVRRLEQEARAAVTAGDLAGATRLYDEAASLQRRLNRDYDGTRFASAEHLEQIEATLGSLGAIPLARDRDRLLDQAAELDRAGVAPAAANLLQQARDRQAQINREFPRSREASPERWDELEVSRQTVASRPGVAAWRARLERLDGLLRARRPDEARAALAEAIDEAAALAAEFPRSRLLAGDDRGRLDFLHALGPDLEMIQAHVLGQLESRPGAEPARRAVISRAVFDRVLGGASGGAGDAALPAAAVPAAEAAEFCRRLGWVLARPVHLPTPAEVPPAAGGVDPFTVIVAE